MFIYFILMILFLTIFVFICRYPTRSDCPDWSGATNPEVEDEPWHSDSYSMNNYYFPDLVTTRAALAAIIQVSILVLLSPTKFVHMI